MYCEILLSMLGYSSESLFQRKHEVPSQIRQESQFSSIGKDIRRLTQPSEDFSYTKNRIKQLIFKVGDDIMIDPSSKICKVFDGNGLHTLLCTELTP